MNFPDSDFWNYSLQIYQTPEVEQACLGLQNGVGADINVLLFCCWAGENQVELSLQQIQQLIKAAQPWQTIIQPLRQSRYTLKHEVTALDNGVAEETMTNLKEMELNAEHMAQLDIEKAVDISSIKPDHEQPGSHFASYNTANYLLQLESVSTINDISQPLEQLLDAIYQDPETIQASLMAMA